MLINEKVDDSYAAQHWRYIEQVNITKNCTQGNNRDLYTYIKTSIIYPITYVSLTRFPQYRFVTQAI